jgi:hypothetical protein
MSEDMIETGNYDSEPYTDGELVTMLRDCKASHGQVTVDVFAMDPSYCRAETVIRRFGTWSQATEEAQLDLDANRSPLTDQYSKEQVCSHLRALHRRHGNATPGLLNNEDDLVETFIVIDMFAHGQMR